MAVALFLKLSKSGAPIKGECQDVVFQGMIQLRSFQMSSLSMLAGADGDAADAGGDACSFTIKKLLDGSSAEIEAGPLRMKVALDEITGVEGDVAASKPAAPTSMLQSVTETARRDEGTPTDEINVIGMTVDEATGRLDKFLDDAALANRSKVRIIHGHGTGALRKGIGTFLASHPLVEKHSFETEERGGKAITIVELQK